MSNDPPPARPSSSTRHGPFVRPAGAIVTVEPSTSNRAPNLIGDPRRHPDIDRSASDPRFDDSTRTARSASSLPTIPIDVSTASRMSPSNADARSPNATTIGVTSVPATGAGQGVTSRVTAPDNGHVTDTVANAPTDAEIGDHSVTNTENWYSGFAVLIAADVGFTVHATTVPNRP